MFVRPGLVLVVLALLAGGVTAAAVPKYDTAEVVLHSTQVYDGSAGTPNPFTTVELTLNVTAPDGRTFQVDGFFDGNGSGGAVGDVFKARIFLDQEGTWSWTSVSATAGLGGQNGEIDCAGTLAGVFGKGPIGVRSPRPRYFAHADGTPIFLAGKMLDFDSPTPLQRTTMTFFSEVLTDADRRTELDYQHDLQVNKMAIYLYNKNDFDGTEPTTPWPGVCDNCDRTRFVLSRWHMYETWTRTLRDEGMVAQLWFFADNSGVGGFSMADRLRLIRYGMARLSAYANTMFIATVEWEEGFSSAEIEQAGVYLQSFNPWRRQSSTHCLPGVFDFPHATWADYMATQSGITSSFSQNHAAALATRALAAKPSQSEEFAQGFESGGSRIKAWSVFTAAQAGIGTGAYLYFLDDFAREVPFYKMEPADSLIVSGPAYAMAEHGYHYVVYLYQNNPVTLNLTGVSGTFEARWFDPLTAIWTSGGTVTGGGTPIFDPPGFDDMALWLRPLVSGSTPPPRVTALGFATRTAMDWEDTVAAASYDVVKGSLETLRAQEMYSASVTGCLENDGSDRRASDAASPAPGEGFWYLVRAVRSNGVSGSFSMAQPGERPGRDAEIAAAAGDCP